MECFAVYADELEGRIDPNPYHPIRRNTIKKLKDSEFQLLLLKDVVEFKKQIVTSKSDDLIYIGLENIESNTGVYIQSEEKKEEFGTAFKFEKGDILFPKLRPYLNKVHLAEFDGVCSTEFYVLNTKKCDNVYLFSFLNSPIVVNQTSYLMTGNTLPRLQTEEVENLIIPIPSIQIQNKIIEITKKLKDLRKQKESESKKLFDSINNYVLEELGIKLPESKYKMAYVVNSTEIENKRCDPYYFQPKFEELADAMIQGKFDNVLFEQLITDLKNGVEIRTYKTEGYRYLRVTDLCEYGINNKDPRFVDAQEIPKRIKLTRNDVLISRSGSLGLVSTVTEEVIDAILSSHIFKVSIDTNKVNSEYLTIYLRSPLGQFQFFRENNGGIVPEINQSALKSLNIILPSIAIQNKIADEVRNRMHKAEQLKIEAKEELERAKQEVERIILG